MDIEKLKLDIQPYFDAVGGHEFSHTERVYNLAIKIAKTEDIDLEVVKIAALLHDIARLKEDNKEVKCHAEEGAKIAKQILKEKNFPEDKIEKIVHCIKAHRYSKKLRPETKEAEILQDADRLDALGAIIIGRVFSFDGKNNIPLHVPDIPPKEVYEPYNDSSGINHFREKTLKIKPETFHTKKAREISRGRYEFVKKFVDRFEKEWKGEL